MVNLNFYFVTKIFNRKYAKLSGTIDVMIKIDDPCINKNVELNPNDKLSDIRKKLKEKKGINETDTLSFAMKKDEFSLIVREEEDKRSLDTIICREENSDCNILYLRKDSKPNWEFFVNGRKLDYGYTIVNNVFKEAKNRAIIIGNCEETNINKLVERDYNAQSCEDFMTLERLILTADSNIQEFTKFGSSIENSRIRKYNYITNSTYHMCEYSKISLKLKNLKATPEFTEAVKKAIESKDVRKFKEITGKFGQFIPTKVVLGGRLIYNESDVSKESEEEDSSEGTTTACSVQNSSLKIGKKFFRILRRKNYSKNEKFELFGGKQSVSKNLNEDDWIESLDDFRKWECIKFTEPISIFKSLPKDLRKQILSLYGKKIHHSAIQNFNYDLEEFGQSEVFELEIPDMKIREILNNEDADCNIFATVIDTGRIKKDYFHCQVLWPQNEYPKLIIHCIQKNQQFRRRECNLKICWMIIGYDTNFNFNQPNFNERLKVQKYEFNASADNGTQDVKYLLEEYGKDVSCIGIPVLKDPSDKSLVIGHHFFNDQEKKKFGSYVFSYNPEKRHYDNLPDFTFCTLIIQNCSKFGSLRFKRTNMIRSLFIKPKPKFVSLCSKGEDICGPIFLKQKVGEIKKVYIDISDGTCYIDNCLCKNTSLKQLEKDLKFMYFSPKTDINIQNK